ncbi:MAG: hypothetical protein K0A90_02525 [Methanosarcinaceae archaeon]|nr:hypothetical protein [Methanosarcinaceae archaeon]
MAGYKDVLCGYAEKDVLRPVPVYPLQTGAVTPQNMNTNEMIANRAFELF